MLSKSKSKYYKDGLEITVEEYTTALAEVKAKAAWVDTIYKGIASIEDVPTQWREEIQRRVAERQIVNDPELTTEEVLEIIIGGVI